MHEPTGTLDLAPGLSTAGRRTSIRELGVAVRDALRGAPRDYTVGAIGPAILALAVPMVLEMAMESIFAVTDIYVASRLGASAVAAVGLTESLLTTLYAIAMGLAIGATAVVARRVGAQDRDGAARAAVQVVALGVIVSAVFGIVGAWQAPRLLALMGAPSEVLAIGTGYARVMLGGSGTILLLFLVNAVFRGAGDAAVSMRALWLANGINIVLAPTLVLGLGPVPAMGLVGAAIATTIGRGVGVLYAASHFVRGGAASHLRVERRHVALEPATMTSILRLSATGALQSFIATASWVALVRIVSTFGASAVAGYTIAVRVLLFALLPAWGLSNAASTMVGQALGAGKPERAEQAVWRTGLYNFAFLGSVGVLLLAFAPGIVGIFTDDPAVVPHAVAGLRILASAFGFYAYGMVLTQAFNGAGDALTPTFINLGAFWAFAIPVGWLLAHPMGTGSAGVFIADAVAFAGMAVVGAVLFRRGRWKLRSV